MKRFTKNSTAWTLFLIRKRYQEKRHKAKWKNRKKNKSVEKHRHIVAVRKHQEAPYIDHKAPDNFSFINNTNEVLKYFNEAKKIFYNKENVNFDISDVSQMTPIIPQKWLGMKPYTPYSWSNLSVRSSEALSSSEASAGGL